MDATSTEAGLTDADIELTKLFCFGENGLVSGMHGGTRAATIAGKAVMMPSEGRIDDYCHPNGMMVLFYG